MVGIGIIAVLRFISGAAAGNTAPAALAYLSEHAPQCPNLHASLVPASMAAGACAAAGLALVLSWVMSPAVLAASGWRVVLVMSLLGNAVAGGLRGWVLQEPEGQMQEAELRDRANRHVGRILRCVVWFGLGGWCWGCWAGG
jgi:MFS family permease